VKIVVKIGGAALEDKATLRKCAQGIVELAKDGHRVAVVHGLDFPHATHAEMDQVFRRGTQIAITILDAYSHKPEVLSVCRVRCTAASWCLWFFTSASPPCDLLKSPANPHSPG